MSGDPGGHVAEWLDAEGQRVWRSYLAVTSMLTERLDRRLQERSGLTLVEYAILVHLSEAPDRRIRMLALADTVLVSKSRLSHQVTRLERDGHVRREPCAEDRRGHWAILTDKGYAALRAAAPGHVADVRTHLFDRLDPEQTVRFGEILANLEDGLRTTRKPS